MKVCELIALLSEFSGDTEVVVEAYENGYDSLDKASTIKIVENPAQGRYDGEFCEDVGQYDDLPELKRCKAVILT